jgi:hypothetical protein
MKTKILVALLVMFLLSAGFGSQVASAEGDHPRLYFNQNDLDYLRALRSSPSHQAIWGAIKDWADTHVNDSPPSEPTGQWFDAAVNTKTYLETMAFMYAMTGDPAYADAAKDWMLSVIGWSAWGTGSPPSVAQSSSKIILGVCFGYDVLYDYLTSPERDAIRQEIITQTDFIVQLGFSEPYPNHTAVNSGAIGIAALTLGDEYDGSSDWLSYAINGAQSFFDYGGGDGSWFEGMVYNPYSMDGLAPFLDALKRVKGQDLFGNNDFLRNIAYFYIYMTYNGRPLQFEDCNWHEGYSPEELVFIYRLASEYSNGYAQWFADEHASQSMMQSFIWKNPNLTATPPADLPLTRHFSDIGYVVFRTGWGEDDLLFAFKSGSSRGHAHNSQNEFGIYYQSKPITCGPGYVCNTSLDATWSHNCLLVDGKGQGQEPGDYQSLPLGTTGVIERVDVHDPYYRYLLGDASAVYNGQSGNGDLDEWRRHVVFVENPDYFIIFDQLEAASAKQFSYILNLPLLRWHGSLPGVSVDGNLVNLNQEGIQIKAQILEPAGFTYQITPYQHSYNFGQDNQLRINTPTAASTAQFLIAIYPNEVLPTEEVKVGNCLGVVITIDNNKDLILFSADGNPVNEYIELEGSYRAADGGSYIFENTGVRVQFNSYQVLRLSKSTGVTPPVITSVEATNITTSSATITWTTDQPATSQVDYGTTEDLGLSSELDTSLVTAHSVTLADLSGPTIYYRVKSEDGSGNLSTSGIYNFTTGSANLPPVLNPIGDKSANEGELIQFTISATDPDDDNLTYSASNLPQGASFDPQTRTFSWIPDEAGIYPNVHFEVSDGSLTDSEDITITVFRVVNPSPIVINPIGNKSVNVGELLQFTISVFNHDNGSLTYLGSAPATDHGSSLTYSASNLPPGASFDPQTRTFSWIPDEAGIYPDVHFEVSDGSLTDSEDITITVRQGGVAEVSAANLVQMAMKHRRALAIF